jgi:hypothetical protein
MAFVRRRTVEVDGASIEVAPLTCEQMEQFLDTQKKIIESDESNTEKVSKLDSLWFKFVACGLNNALNGASTEATQFSEERLRKEFDKPSVMLHLKPVIMDMTGIFEKGQISAPEAPSA